MSEAFREREAGDTGRNTINGRELVQNQCMRNRWKPRRQWV